MGWTTQASEAKNHDSSPLHRLFGIRSKLKVKTGVLGSFGVEVAFESASGGVGKFGDALVIRIRVCTGDEGVDVADLELGVDAIAVFLECAAAVDASGTLEVAEGFTEGFVAATENPVDNFAFAHDIEVVHGEIAAELHGFDNVGDKLEGGAGAVAMEVRKEGERGFGEFLSDFKVAEADFLNAVFVFENSEIIGEAADLVETSPSVVEEVAAAKSVFDTVDGEAGDFVIDNRIDFAIGNFASENAVFFQLAHDRAGVADDFAGTAFDRFLFFAITIHDIDAMFERWGSDVMEEGGKGGFLVMGEAPSEESDTDTMSEDGLEILEGVETGVIPTTGHADAAETLHVGSGDVF